MDWLSWELTGTVPRWYVYLFNYLVAPAPAAYGSSQARGCIRAAAASLHHSHSNTGAEWSLQATPQLTMMLFLDTPSEVWD